MRNIRRLATIALASLISMAFGYGLVSYVFQHKTPPPTASDAARLESEMLRAFSNDLLRLTAEFQDRHQENMLEPMPAEFSAWLQNDFRPRLNDLRRRMNEATIQGDPLSMLIQASERVTQATSRPDDRDLRSSAASAVLAAADAAEARIQQLGVPRALDEPPETGQIDTATEAQRHGEKATK